MKRLWSWLAARKQDAIATAALASVAVGCGMERLSLAFIVPGGVVFGLLVLGRLTGRA